jgi:hypothetical protein
MQTAYYTSWSSISSTPVPDFPNDKVVPMLFNNRYISHVINVFCREKQQKLIQIYFVIVEEARE